MTDMLVRDYFHDTGSIPTNAVAAPAPDRCATPGCKGRTACPKECRNACIPDSATQNPSSAGRESG
ncbi:MAG TPA: hypothetical protein VF006_09150 [Longimicrobium sp.]